ncbi:MAG: toprim domain-containing protein [Oscillospiraceae bacterium]
MPYVSKKEIEQARNPDLLSFLQQYSPEELVRVNGSDAYQLKSHSSLKISNGKWCWWSHDKLGGTNALEYLIKVKNMGFPEAVQLVNQQCSTSSSRQPYPSPRPVSNEKSEFELPNRAANNKRVTAYLLSRGIDMEILDYCFQSGRLYEEAQYHNAVFVGYDCEKPKYATLRGTLPERRFIREVEGSDKAFCFSIAPEASGKTLNVFECAIDALSYLTMQKMLGQNWREEAVLSLGGVYRQEKDVVGSLPVALKTYLEKYENLNNIVLRLDNDATGRSAAQTIAAALEPLRATIKYPERGKDCNEWLMLQKGIYLQQAVAARTQNEPER